MSSCWNICMRLALGYWIATTLCSHSFFSLINYAYLFSLILDFELCYVSFVVIYSHVNWYVRLGCRCNIFRIRLDCSPQQYGMGSSCRHNSFCVWMGCVPQHICYKFWCLTCDIVFFCGFAICSPTFYSRWFELLRKVLVILFEKRGYYFFYWILLQLSVINPDIIFLFLLLSLLLFVLFIKCTCLYGKQVVITSLLPCRD